MKSRSSSVVRRRSVRTMHLEGLETRNLMAGLPDYAALYVDAPASLDSGQALVRIPWSVKNIGQGDGGRFISLDMDLVNVTTGQSRSLSQSTMPDLAAGRSHGGSETLTIPSGLTSGYYDVVLRIDRANSHPESNETNNEASDRVWINGTTPSTPPPSSTSPDVRESNNTSATATDVLPIQSLSSLSIHSSTDVDYFRFAIPPGSTATGTITMDITGGDLDIALYDHTGNKLQDSTSTTSQESLTVTQLPSLGIGNYYYLKVYGYAGNTGSYSLNLNLNTSGIPGNPPPSSSTPDARESNNTLATATDVLPIQSLSSLSIHSSTDVDYFRFAIPPGYTAAGTITMDITGGDLDIALYDHTGNKLQDSTSWTSTERLTVTQLPALGIGNYYYLKVYGFAGNTGNYSLNLNLINTPTSGNPGNPAGLVRDSVGLLDPVANKWYLSNRHDWSSADLTTFTTPVVPSWWIPISGDWNGDGTDTVGLYDQYSSTWYLNNSPTGSLSSLITVRTPTVPSWWVPVTGDWNGDGRDSIGLYDPYGARWYLNNRVDGSISDLIVVQTPAVPSTWRPITGDWDGNGTDTIGLLDNISSRWYLNNRLDGSTSSLITFQTPFSLTSGTPIAGDWNNDGRDTVGVYDASARTFRLNNRTDGSTTDMVSVRVPDSVPTTWKPLVGNWDGVASSTSSAAASLAAGEGESADLLSAALEDVNRDGVVSPADVLCVFNALNALSSDSQSLASASKESSDERSTAMDVDGDGVLRPHDALLVINAILAQDQHEDLVIAHDDEDDLFSLLAADTAYASQVGT